MARTSTRKKDDGTPDYTGRHRGCRRKSGVVREGGASLVFFLHFTLAAREKNRGPVKRMQSMKRIAGSPGWDKGCGRKPPVKRIKPPMKRIPPPASAAGPSLPQRQGGLDAEGQRHLAGGGTLAQLHAVEQLQAEQQAVEAALGLLLRDVVLLGDRGGQRLAPVLDELPQLLQRQPQQRELAAVGRGARRLRPGGEAVEGLRRTGQDQVAAVQGERRTQARREGLVVGQVLHLGLVVKDRVQRHPVLV